MRQIFPGSWLGFNKTAKFYVESSSDLTWM